MQQADITWNKEEILGSPWIYKSAETMMVDGAKKKTEYHYVPAHQGGRQYGNLTHVKEYLDEGNMLYRTKETTYVPNDQDGTPDNVIYLVSAPVRQLLWDAEVGQSCEADTAFFYDESEVYGQPPTKGQLTMVHVADEACDGSRIITKSRYDAWGNPIEQTNALGNSTTTIYDTSENTSEWPRLYSYPMNVTVPLLGTTHYNWNKIIGQVSSVEDVNGVVTKYDYDKFGRLYKEWAPGNGNNASTTIINYHDYDEASNTPYHVSTAKRTTIGHEPEPDIFRYIGVHTYYDGLGQEIQTRSTYINPQNQHKHAVTRTDYNALGSPSVVYAPVEDDGDLIYRGPDWPGWQNQPKSVSEYDALGRVIKQFDTDGVEIRHYYATIEDNGLPLTFHDVIDRNRHRKQVRSDMLGRTVQVFEITGNCGNYRVGFECGGNFNQEWRAENLTRYEYDVADRLVKLIDDAGNETTMSYDLAGRKTGMNDPDMGVWAYKYDILGNLTRQTDARGTRLCFFYDELNRVTGKQYRNDDNCLQAGALDVSYFYDENQYGKGQRTRMEDASGSTSWQYDEKGRVKQESKIIDHNGTPLTFTTEWSYDASDRIHTMTYPADEEGNLGETVTYEYSQDEHETRAQVEGLVSDLGTYVSGMEYNVYGQLTEATLATGTSPSQHVTQRFNYYALDQLHGLGRLREIESYKSAQPLLQRLNYTYDGVGNVLSIQNDLNGETQNEQFSYDYLDRLLTGRAADGNNGLYSTDYTYDDIGNLTSKGGTSYTYGTQASNCTAGALDKPHAVTSQGAWEYCYDANGNMTNKVLAGFAVATNYNYDDENRLTEVTDNNGTPIATYTYDGDGNRVKVAETQTTFYVGNHIQWRNGTLTKYYYVGSTRVAMREGDTLSFILANQLGSATVTLDSTGNVQSELRYHPFGETRHSNGTTPTSRRFTGQIQDEGTGLYYYNARYYDPAIGRFIQADTIVPEPGNPQSLNRYSYVYNNPLKYTDPTGHCPMCLAAVFGISKGIDYGLTAWDTYQSGRVLLDPNASDADKMFASLNIALAAGFELLEPDDMLPVGVPADDIARRAFMDGARTAFDEGGERGLRSFIRDNAGDGADDLLRQIGLGCSFSEDTLVITQEGFKEISDLQIGDLVLAYNEALDTIDIYPITAVWSHFDSVIVDLTLDNEQIETTPEHPFFIAGDKWVAAGDLWLGARVFKSDGTYGTVRAIQKQKRPQIMYNLTVDTAHTYFVGRQQWLVHNACPSVSYSRINPGSGPENIVRIGNLGSLEFQFSTGHGFNRSHTGPGGVVTDFRTTSLTADQVENAIAHDVAAHLGRGGTIPRGGGRGSRPIVRQVDVGGINVGYRVMQLPNDRYAIGTYFIVP